MDQQLIEKVMKQVSDELGIGKEECKAEAPKEECCGNIGLWERQSAIRSALLLPAWILC